MSQIARILGKEADVLDYDTDFVAAREQFRAEWTTPNGRMVCESQTAYALALCLDILSPEQRIVAGERLSEIVRRNAFKIGTGFAGTPYVCEALAQTGHADVAYAMLLNQECPSWLYPVFMGATTTWERWDSMLPDGSINPGEMTSFNHYAFGAVAKFLHERLAGLSCIDPGWKKVRVEPLIGANITWASASHLTPYGRVSVSWKVVDGKRFKIDLQVPQSVTMEVTIPDGLGKRQEILECGQWSFETEYKKTHEWPVSAISPMPF
jgi:alpha-L-rhamnosidase